MFIQKYVNTINIKKLTLAQKVLFDNLVITCDNMLKKTINYIGRELIYKMDQCIFLNCFASNHAFANVDDHCYHYIKQRPKFK